jgi:hypothetical protein
MENVANFSSWLGPVLATDLPVLPGLDAMRWGMHSLWAVVLACGVLWLAGRYRLGCRWPWAVAVGVAAVAVWPSSFSPAYWLGLAFQSPSLTTGVLCCVWVVRWWSLSDFGKAGRGGPGASRACSVAAPAAASSSFAQPSGVWLYLVGVAVLWGWVLGFDVWAGLGLSASVYALGFSPAAVGLVAALAMLPWVAGARGGSTRAVPLEVTVVLAVLLLFVLTRLPNGNLWDALLDPWLWVVLQVRWWVGLVRRAIRSAR